MTLPDGMVLEYLGAQEGDTIPSLLELSARLQSTLVPIFTWNDLLQIILSRRLELLHRHPILEQVYIERFNPLVKREYGGAEPYLREKLGWPAEEYPSPESEKSDKSSSSGAYWRSKDEVVVRKNDWPYSIPKEAEHFVCWTRLPIYHPSLCLPPAQREDGTPASNTWSDVQALGLGGCTGIASEWCTSTTSPALWPGQEISAFVKSRWNEKEYETLWYANPPHLQSVKGLSHWHVLVRPRPAFREGEWCKLYQER